MHVTTTSIELMVDDVPLTLSFYQQVLGAKVLAQEEESGLLYWALVDLAGTRVSFKNAVRLRKEATFFRDTTVGGAIALCLNVDDLQASYAFVQQACDTLDHPHLTPCGGKQFSLKDNNGYVITFEQHG